MVTISHYSLWSQVKLPVSTYKAMRAIHQIISSSNTLDGTDALQNVESSDDLFGHFDYLNS